MKLLTVTIPCYNSEAYMEKCIESLLPGAERVEIIIIDDGSTDRTGAIADACSKKYPDFIKVIHQENGGHGAGINQGIRHATGKYFKFVDSDDTLSADFPEFLDKLEFYDNQGGVDLFVTNFCYVFEDSSPDRSIRYGYNLPEGRILAWSETRPFLFHQFLSHYSCTFRTDLLRQIKEDLPLHTFYEDNLLIYRALPFVKKICYLNRDLYRYAIGRPGQSMDTAVLSKHYRQQIMITEKCFTSCHIDSIPEPLLKKCMTHQMFMLFSFAIIYARLNQNARADRDIEEMWQYCRDFDEKRADYFRKRASLVFLDIKGKTGWKIVGFIYNASRRILLLS